MHISTRRSRKGGSRRSWWGWTTPVVVCLVAAVLQAPQSALADPVVDPADSSRAAADASAQCADTEALRDALDVRTAEITDVISEWNTEGATRLTRPLGTSVPSEAFCEVQVSMTHGVENGFGPDAMHVWVWLPQEWNGRLQAVGGGGTNATHGAGSMVDAVADGYAVMASDSGVTGDLQPNIFLDGSDRFNWQIFENWTYRGVWESTLVAQALVEATYDETAAYSYWNGCSNGGRQGLAMAQRFPDLFDGVLSAAPAIYGADRLNMTMSWPAMVQNDELGENLSTCKLAHMAESVRDYCDGDDGLRDGLVAAPEDCGYEAALETVRGKKLPCGTVSRRDVRIATRIFEGPRTEAGQQVWFGHTPGVDLTGGVFRVGPSFAFQNFAFADTSVDWTDYTAQDLVTSVRDRFQGRLELLASADPVLEPFRRSGGKVLMWHGLSDGLFPAAQSTHYYDEVAKLSGDRTSDFFRLFLAPGVDHCSGGPGHEPTDPFDSLVQWVEEGEAPDSLPAAHVEDGRVVSERNLCAYPQQQIYTGGPITEATSFTCGDAAAPVTRTATTVTAPRVTGVRGRPVSARVTVRSKDGEPEGVVDAKIAGKVVATVTLEGGQAQVSLGAYLPAAATQVTFVYRGYGAHQGSRKTVPLKLAKAPSTVTARSPKVVVARGGHLRLNIRVSAGVPVAGQAKIRGFGPRTTRVRAGRATLVIRVPKRAAVGPRKLTVVFPGSATVARSTTTLRVRVTR